MAKKSKRKTIITIVVIAVFLLIIGLALWIFLQGEVSPASFRTTGLNYGLGSSVAFDFTETCGNNLTALGFDFTGSLEGNTCETLFGMKTIEVPCSWDVDDCKAYINDVGTIKLIDICSNKADRYSEYINTKPSNIDISSESIDKKLEVRC